jgi:predicted lipoprotein with Yx(FWY)xxD motif
MSDSLHTVKARNRFTRDSAEPLGGFSRVDGIPLIQGETMNRSRTVLAAVALTSVFTVTACARPGDQAADLVAAPAAVAASAEAPPPELAGVPEDSAPEQSAVETPDPQSTPIPEPTVAKTQKWVKIYSGPAKKDVTPPKSILTGSKTVELNATENEKIGTYVADGAGRTLYRFDNDSNKPPKATCNGDCAVTWPPLLIKSPGKIFPKGIDPEILGYVERADGTCQVTINGWPVYYFAKDAKPGDILGQGVKGTWFAVAPNGGKTEFIPEAEEGSGTGGSDTGSDQESEEDGGTADAPADPGY